MDLKVVQTKGSLRQHQGKIVLGTIILLVTCVAACVLIPAAHSDNNFIGSEPERSLQRKTTKTTSDFTIVKTYMREGPQHYTQGLIWKDSKTLIESVGQYGKSAIQYVSFPSMAISKRQLLNDKYFAEGIEMYTKNGVSRIFQLTWKERDFLVRNADTLKLESTKTIPSAVKEGWGLTKNVVNGKLVFYASDGTGNIHQLDPDTLKVQKTIACKKYDGSKLNRLNELEMVNGKIWANIYLTSNIAIIDPSTGYADYIINFSRLETLAKAQVKKMGLSLKSDHVLNGIAYDSTRDKLIVTGKMWPMMWEIKMNEI